MNKRIQEPISFYFCDNKEDADQCASLVVQGIKQATATSLWWFERIMRNSLNLVISILLQTGKEMQKPSLKPLKLYRLLIMKSPPSLQKLKVKETNL